MALPHKEIVFPELAVTGDDGADGWEDGRWQDIAGSGGMSRYRRQPGDHAAHVAAIQAEWHRVAAEYEANPDGFYESYYYLDGHPAFWHFREGGDERPATHVTRLEPGDGLRACVYIMVVRVCPATERIEDDEQQNTATRVWFELGKHSWPPDDGTWHDWLLDGGAQTYEGAIIKAARAVWEAYGNDRRIADSEEYGSEETLPVVQA